MADLLIRNIKETTVEKLKLQAKLNHRSLQGELKAIIEAAVKMNTDEAIKISSFWHNRLSGKAYGDSAESIREDRKR